MQILKQKEREEFYWPKIFAVLGDKTRFCIMRILLRNKERCVSEIAEELQVSVSAISQHLRIMEMSGLVECERMGQMMCYKPKRNNPRLRKIIKLIY